MKLPAVATGLLAASAFTAHIAHAQTFEDLPQMSDNGTMPNFQRLVLTPLPYAYDALEPHVSAQIMELHHKRHHQAYVDNYNAAAEELEAWQKSAAGEPDDERGRALRETQAFNFGGNVNHAIFWNMLAPTGSPDTSLDGRGLEGAIVDGWGSGEEFRDAFFKYILQTLKASGWGWVVCDHGSGKLSFTTTRDQEIVEPPELVIVAVDMWEHAYYLQHYNNKRSYLDAIWNVVNWAAADQAYSDCLDSPASPKN